MRPLLIAFALLGTALAQRQPLQLKDYYQIESVSEPTLSPDARQVAFTHTRISEADNKRLSEIWLAPADGSTPPRRISDPAASATNPRWSADGKLLAYTSAGQWFVRIGAPDQTPFHIPGVAGAPLFSPDNQWSRSSGRCRLSQRDHPNSQTSTASRRNASRAGSTTG